MKFTVEIEQATGSSSESVPVQYRWDASTQILSANWGVLTAENGQGYSGSVGIEGADGSWVILDVADGLIRGVEIAVWPDVRDTAALDLPARVDEARVVVPSSASAAINALQTPTRVAVEAGPERRSYHFRVGALRVSRAIRLARDLLLDVDANSQISGFWLLNVPPCPSDL